MKLKVTYLHLLKSVVFSLITGIVLIVIIAFTNTVKKGVLINKNMPIVFLNHIDNTLISKKKIVERIKTHKLWQQDNKDYQLLSEIEKDIAKNSYVKKVLVFINSKGAINIKMDLHKPIARLARDDSSDAYITKEGYVKSKDLPMPLRLLVITGDYTKRIIEQNKNEKSKLITTDFLGFLHEINNNSFYNSNIAQLDINSHGEITIIPQVGKQKFLLGTARRYKEKLKKFKLTYTNIFPKKGWGYYNEVNLKFKNQIIAY